MGVVPQLPDVPIWVVRRRYHDRVFVPPRIIVIPVSDGTQSLRHHHCAPKSIEVVVVYHWVLPRLKPRHQTPIRLSDVYYVVASPPFYTEILPGYVSLKAATRLSFRENPHFASRLQLRVPHPRSPARILDANILSHAHRDNALLRLCTMGTC